MPPTTSVSLIGSTGSIGTQAIDVVDACPDRFSVVAIGAQRSVDLLADQARRLTTRSRKDQETEILDCLQHFFGPQAGRPASLVVQD